MLCPTLSLFLQKHRRICECVPLSFLIDLIKYRKGHKSLGLLSVSAYQKWPQLLSDSVGIAKNVQCILYDTSKTGKVVNLNAIIYNIT